MLFDRAFPFFDVSKTLEEMDRLFGAFGQPLELRSVPRGTFPAMNIYEKGDTVILTVEIPGVETKDLDISVVNASVTLKTERKDNVKGSDRYYRKERPTGTFERTVTLPVSVNPNAVNAEYINGILKVTMEKAEQAKVKKIEIKS